MPRRSTRSSPSRQTTEEEQHTREVKDKVKNNDDLPLSSDGDSDEEQEIYEFNGIQFRTYQEMVQAKRERNQRVLQASGLLDMDLSNGSGKRRQSAASNKTEVSQRGLKRQRAASRNKAPPPPRRKSNRLQGIASDGLYVRDESGGRFTIAAPEQGAAGKAAPSAAGSANAVTEGSGFYRNRLNDGSDMTLEEAVTKHVGEKWFTDNALTRAQALCQTHLSEGNAPVEENSSSPAGYRRGGSPRNSGGKRTAKKTSPKSVLETLHDEEQTSPPLECPSRLLESLSVDRPNQVAKVVPDRIYGMAVHPGMDHLVVCAGDKQGYVGLWKCPDERESAEEDDFSNDVHLFKYHSGAAASLQWTSDGKSLFSTSYDGTCRLLDVATETVGSVFAAYDDEEEKYSNQPGYGLDGGYSYWTQFGCLDHRQEDCFFISTSTGCVYHIDSRIPGRRALTWQHELSERKINTVSLHPNGHSLVTAGLDCHIRLWDIRHFGGKKTPSPIVSCHGGKSINSALFSPSGSTLVATTMNNKLDLLDDFHLQTASKKNAMVKPTHSIRHDNHTGRWLTTFQAVWHPLYEIFGIGSMSKPRVVEVFGQAKQQCAVGGDSLTAVASRLAFHPRTDHIILAGGNSSGRVTIVR